MTVEQNVLQQQSAAQKNSRWSSLMSTVCVLKVGAFWACSLQKGLQQDRIACLAGQVRLPAPADIFESAERNYWDQRCPDTTASLEDSNGNLELAVAFLTAKNAKDPSAGGDNLLPNRASWQ
nr:ubiquitin carboxyl-terminal hydrolase 25-like [Equus asinus]